MAKRPADRFSKPAEVRVALAPWSQGAALGELLNKGRGGAHAGDEPARRPAPARPPETAADTGPSPRGNSLGRAILYVGCTLLLVVTAVLVGQLRNHAAPDAAGGTAASSQPTIADRQLAERNRRAIQWLTSLNARIGVLASNKSYGLINPGDRLPAGPLQLHSVDLGQQSNVHDEDMARLRGLASLRLLNLSDTNIGDDGLLRLGPLPALENLFLVRTPITDRGLAQLEECPRLKSLYLANTKITDAGLRDIAACKGLNELALSACPISDAGLPELQGLTFLRVLDLHDTQVTRDGVAELEAALPSCSIKTNFNGEKQASGPAPLTPPPGSRQP